LTRDAPHAVQWGTGMANTYTALHYQFVFSTKNRRPWIKPEMETRIWEYLGGIARANKIKPLKTGGINDHIHMLLGAPPTIAPSKIAQLVKGGSSAWIHETFPELADFAWQDGYAAFTVSKSAIPDVTLYIARQREHHRKMTFQEEYRALLDRHGIEYDERYVWD
jgi:REP-associated tyrosine transposase